MTDGVRSSSARSGDGPTLVRRVGPRPAPRLAALGAIVLDAAGFVILFLLVLDRPLMAVSVVVITLALVASVLVALAGSRVVRVMASVISIVMAALLVAILLEWGVRADGQPWLAPFAFALLIAGALLARAALHLPPPAAEREPVVVRHTRATQRPVLLINPRSGGGKAAQFGLAEQARSLGIEAIVLHKGEDLRRIAHAAVDRGADALGMAGGDGSQAVVLGVAVERDVPFVCVPAGTRNHFALDLGLNRADPRQALDAFVDGEERRVDFGTVNDRVFVNNVALGVYAALVEQATYRDSKLHTTLELLPQLVADGGPWFDLTFDVPGQGTIERSALLMVSNNAYAIGAAEIRQRPRLDAGQLGIVALNPDNLGDLLALTVMTAAKRPWDAKALWMWTAPEFVVGSRHDHLSAGVDGETVHLTTPIRFRIVPGGARLLVPAGSRVGLDEQRRASTSSYSGLLEVAFDLPSA